MVQLFIYMHWKRCLIYIFKNGKYVHQINQIIVISSEYIIAS